MKNFSLIKESIETKKDSLRSESCRDYDIKCQNFWYIYGIDSDEERSDESYGEYEGPVTKKKILESIKAIPQFSKFTIQGHAYSLDRTLAPKDRWEYADPYDTWEVVVDRNLNIVE